MELLGGVTIVLLVCIACLLSFAAWKGRSGKGKMPPGPAPLPILGNLLQVKPSNLAKTLQKLSEEYGPVFTVHLGSDPVVVLHGYDVVKEALIDRADEFAARGHMPIGDRTNNGLGIIFSNNELWLQVRRFSLTTLRNFGMGKRSIEERIQEESDYLLEEINKTKEKIQEEIDQVVGRSRKPCVADRTRMPYTDAVIHEIQRFISLVPLSLPHTVTKDTSFRDYIIPKGTTIFPLLNSVLHDSKEFPNPQEFNPEHFLSKSGTFRKSEFFMPFSAGKRICPGEGLARMEIFLFIVTILQNFTLKSVVNPQELNITPTLSGTSNIPSAYQLCAVPR
uniref:unspecific monooxygenase n=1 Tax=Serinus canaria TaxID=9135 RepID=A0A8C9KPR5_SERCA